MADLKSISAARGPYTRKVKQQFARGEAHVDKAKQRILRHLASLKPGQALHSRDFPGVAAIGSGNVLQVRNALMSEELIEIAPMSRDPADWICTITPRGRMRPSAA